MRLTFGSLATALLLSSVEASPLSPSLKSRAPSQISGRDYYGCQSEATGQRALTGSAFFSDLLTVEKCAAHCSGFTFFGVEYGRECYCGNVLNAGSMPVSEGDCSFACPGNNAETCGAGDRLNVYIKSASASSTTTNSPSLPTTYNSQGCYTEATAGRALNSKAFNSNDPEMTIQKCAANCQGYRYFGLEYYFECYCGNELQEGSVQIDSSECRHPCTGDQTQTCGGDSRLNVYAFGVPSISSSSTSSTVTPTSTPYPGYVTKGCHSEAANQRALSGASYSDDLMTIGICAATCSGFDLFGLEFGRECYCGNSLNSGSIVMEDADCSMACPGNQFEKCGAGNRLNVYQYGPDPSLSSTISQLSTSSISTTASPTYTSTISTTTSNLNSESTSSLSSSSSPYSSVVSSTTTTESTASASISSFVTSTISSLTTESSSSSTSTLSSYSFTTTESSSEIVSTTSLTTTTTTTTTTTSNSPSPTPVRIIVSNGGFESGNLAPWTGNTGNAGTGSVSSLVGQSGNYALLMSSIQNVPFLVNSYRVRQTVTVIPGKRYQVTTRVNRRAGQCGTSIYVGNVVFQSGTWIAVNGWHDRNSAVVLYPANARAEVDMVVEASCSGAAAGEVWVDDIVLTQMN